MGLNDNELARLSDGAVECRPGPLRISWNFVDLATADDHMLQCRLSCSVRVANNPADRRMFVEVFLTSGNSVPAGTITAHFQSALQNALATIAFRCKAADAVGGTDRAKWLESIKTATIPIAFAAGIEILPPFQLDITSSTLHRATIDQIARARAQERTTGEIEHFERAAELLKKFQALRQSAPDLPPGRLLEQISPTDQGATLQTLLAASARQSEPAPLWAVSGSHLVRVDPRTAPAKIQLLELPTTLGPLRSVQPSEGAMLLIGARDGVMRIDPSAISSAQLYPVPKIDSQLGFNRVIQAGSQIWASHGDVGIVRWSADDPGTSPTVFDERSARNLQPTDESTVIYSIDCRLVALGAAGRSEFESASSSDIISIIPVGDSIVAVHEDGALATFDRAGELVAKRSRGTRLGAASAMPWLGDTRLLLATEAGPVDCIGLNDSLTTEYLSPHRGLKMLAACADLIAAVSPDRQRLIVWHTWDGQRPIGEIHLTNQTRHRVADIDFGSRLLSTRDAHG